MPLQKQQVAVNFQKGLDTKSDPWQVPLGNFLNLENSVFTKQGLLQKRNGFAEITTLNDGSVSTLTTYNNELTAIGNSLYAYNQPGQDFVNKGTFYPIGLTSENLIANNSNLKQIDLAASPNGLTCAVWWESLSPTNEAFKYVVIDTTSNQTLINPASIVPTAGTVSGVAKVFYLNNNFVIIFPQLNGGVQQLQFISINCTTLNVSAAAVVANTYQPYPNLPAFFKPNLGLSWDAVVVNNQIHVGYNRGANGFYVSIINNDLTISVATQIDNTIQASSVGAMTDGYYSYFAYESYLSGLGNIVGIDGTTGVAVLKFAPQGFFNFGAVVDKYVPNITGSVTNGVITVIYERQDTYPYFPSQYGNNYTNQIYKRTCTVNGVVGALPSSPFVKGVGLSSKSFVLNNEIYFSTTYNYGNGISGEYSVFTNQPCYFINDINGKVVTQFSYRNGAGYNNQGLPNVYVETFTGTSIAGSNQINNILDTSNLTVGQRLISANFPIADCYIESIDSISQVTLSRIATSSGATTFTQPTIKLPYLYQAVSQSFAGNNAANPIIFGLNGSAIASVEFFKPQMKTVEAGSNLNIASGFLWNYDGAYVTENNFFLYPDSIYVGGAPNITKAGCNTTLGSYSITMASTAGLKAGQYVTGTGASLGVSYSKVCNTTINSPIIAVPDITNLEVGQFVSGAGIPTNSKIVAINSSVSVTLSNSATATAAGITLTFAEGTQVVQVVDATTIIISNAATATGVATLTFFGGLTAGVYFYNAIYQYIDNKGNIVKSSSAKDFTFTVKPAASITATYAALGSTGLLSAISSNDFAKLQPGQSISGVGVPDNTYILSLNFSNPSNLTAIVSNAPSIPGVGVAISVASITQANVYVPSLRLTYKPNLNVVIYRASTSTGTVFQQIVPVDEPLANDPTQNYVSFYDVYSNESLVARNTLYTTGGVIENSGTPSGSDVTIFDNRVWMIDSENGNLLWYSKPLIETESVEMSDLQTIYVTGLLSEQSDIEGLSAITIMDDKLIIFKQNSIYYINGTGPDATGANSQYPDPIFITGTVGCITPESITYNPLGIIFQSDKGIWILGRDLSTNYFGAPVEKYTQNSLVTSAFLVPGTNQSRFTLDSGITLMYDYFYGQWGTFTGIPNISSTIYDGLHTFLDQYGRVCQETPNKYLDILNPVLMSFTTSWFAIAGIQGFERAYFLFLLGKYYSPHKLNVELAYDFNDGYTQNTIITPENYSAVYGNDPFYGSNEFFGGPSQVEKWRIMLTRQKCDSVQVKVSELYDPSYGVTAGAGLTLSGMNFIIGIKKGYGTISQFNTAG